MTDLILTWINGASALALVISAWVFTFVCVSFYKKTHSKTFPIGGIPLGLAVAFGWTGITISFLSVWFTGGNLPWVEGIISYFSYSTIPVGAMAIIYVVWDVAGDPKKKKIALIVFALFSAVYYYFEFTTFSLGAVQVPDPHGEIFDDFITPDVFFYFIIWAEVGLAAILAGFGFLKFRSMAPGALRRKSTYIVLASVIVATGILWDTVIFFDWIVSTLFLCRLMMIVGLVLIIYGFKPLGDMTEEKK